jgi:RHS repeat-associated protein
VAARVDARGNRTTYGYDALNRLTQTQDALNDLTTTVYDQAGNVLATVDGRGDRTTYGYDADNRQTQVQDALGNLTTTVYDADGDVLARVDARGNRTTYGYDANDRQTQMQDALLNLSTTVYDAAGNVSAVIDPLGHRTTYSYDVLNRQTQVQDALLNLSTTVYDAAGNVLATVDALGHRTTFGYDALNRATQVRDALGDLSTTVYDAAGNVSAAIDARGNRTTYSYDVLNRATTATDPLNHTTTTVYDAAGNVARAIDAAGYTTTFAYDALNRQTTVTDPGGGVATTVYDGNGNVTARTDQLNHTTTYNYDALNRLTRTTDARGGLTTLLYDAVGNRTAETDPDGNTTTYLYDALNRLTQQTDPLNHSATFAYDAASRRTSSTDRLGRQTTYAYDADNRETGETWHNADGTTQQLVSYGYDAAGRQTYAASAAGAYTYAYDALGRQTSVQEPFGLALTYAYDAVSNRTLMQDSKRGTTTFVYDAANRLTSEQFGGSGQTPLRIDFSYTARDQVQTATRYSDLAGTQKVGASSYTYDAVGRLTNLQHFNGAGGSLANYTYAYDLASRLTAETDNGAAPITYSYDATNQLLGDGTTTHSYDLNGNRTNTGYSTTANELSNDGAWTYTYDAEGNQTGKSNATYTWSFGFDDHNQMLWAQQKATVGGTLLQAVTYSYDTQGRLLEEDATSGGTTTTTRFGYGDGDNAWADLNGSNALQTRRLFDNADVQPLARVSGSGTASWELADHLGSIRLLTDNGGVVIDALTYDGFGRLASESSPTNGDSYKYAGYRLDAPTSFQYVWHRYLDPVTLRFTSQDPMGLDPGPNPYEYAGNDSTEMTDPTGLEPPTKNLTEWFRAIDTNGDGKITKEEWLDAYPNGEENFEYMTSGAANENYLTLQDVKDLGKAVPGTIDEIRKDPPWLGKAEREDLEYLAGKARAVRSAMRALGKYYPGDLKKGDLESLDNIEKGIKDYLRAGIKDTFLREDISGWELALFGIEGSIHEGQMAAEQAGRRVPDARSDRFSPVEVTRRLEKDIKDIEEYHQDFVDAAQLAAGAGEAFLIGIQPPGGARMPTGPRGVAGVAEREMTTIASKVGGTRAVGALRDVRNLTEAATQVSVDTCGLHCAGQILEELAPQNTRTTLDVVGTSIPKILKERGGRGLDTAQLSQLIDANLPEAMNAATTIKRGVTGAQLPQLLERGPVIAHVDGDHFVRVLGIVEENGKSWVKVYDPARGNYEQLLDSFIARAGADNQMILVARAR